MNKTPEETKKGLECCAASYVDCHRECPYKPDCDGTQFLKDSLALIQRLQAENADQAETIMWMEAERDDLKRTIRQLEAERDAAVNDLSLYAMCAPCKHSGDEQNGICPYKYDCLYGTKGHFEWRGVQKEANNGDLL